MVKLKEKNSAIEILRIIAMLYTIGAFAAKYPSAKFIKRVNFIMLFCVFILAMLAANIITDVVNKNSTETVMYKNYFGSRSSLFIFGAAIALFISFTKLRPIHSRAINTFSACTFGVYLVHDNKYLRSVLWTNMFNNYNYAETPYLIFHLLCSCAAVYLACAGLEYLGKSF